MNGPQRLTFTALDGLAFAAERGRRKSQAEGFALAARAIGPLMELTGLSSDGLLPFPDEASWVSLNGHARFVAALRSGRQQWICPDTAKVGFFRTPLNRVDNDTLWVAFGLAAQKAATTAGFHRKIAAQFIGAVGEMMSNIYEHSGAPESGIIAFRAADEGFEFVVSDGGIGILESLRSCQSYENLTDHGAALRLAVSDGVSRFGPEVQRGYGFRPIFVGLANLSGSLRFRSGDHALVIDGQRINRVLAKTAQKVRLRGFFASVACQSPRTK